MVEGVAFYLFTACVAVCSEMCYNGWDRGTFTDLVLLKRVMVLFLQAVSRRK